jgi:hypothetical protein
VFLVVKFNLSIFLFFCCYRGGSGGDGEKARGGNLSVLYSAS